MQIGLKKEVWTDYTKLKRAFDTYLMCSIGVFGFGTVIPIFKWIWQGQGMDWIMLSVFGISMGLGIIIMKLLEKQQEIKNES